MRARLTFLLPILVTSLALAGCKKSKNDSSGGDGGAGGQTGDGDTGTNVLGGRIACDEDSECDDGVFCNGEETCRDGFCRQGTRVDCDDDIECTIDRCSESEGRCENALPDKDEDGSADASCTDADGRSGDDCDDENADRYPGNVEVCDPDHVDEDCDPTTYGFRDSDNDGFRDAQCCNEQEDGELGCYEDCDDHKPNVNPMSTEACDFLDNNCDGEIDEGVSVDMYPDKDHDGHGDDNVEKASSCPGAVGFALINDDCDDSDPEVFTGQFEICDDKDNNCNGEADEVKEYAPWYKDQDGDGYGDPESEPVLSCLRVPGRVLSQNDCDDVSKSVNPNATELCDGIDNDCNGKADYRLSGINNFEDDDGDGIPDADCDGGTDCNDTDPRTGDGKEEVCDHVDNDCDGEVDEETVQNIWYIDEDGDGWGVVIGSALASCEPIPTRASQFGDCDDSESGNGIHPGATEICDGIDNDCDGKIDEGAAVSCKLPNAVTTCKFGGCQIYSCVPGFVDIDPAEPGCETAVTEVAPPISTGCNQDIDCSDGNICNGIEVCYQNDCYAGTPINCGGPEVLQGDVAINNGLDIKALEGVEVVTGTVSIKGTLLSNLVGLESLKTIGGDLVITDNNYLTKLSGSALSELESVSGDILIQNNAALTSVDLPSLVNANLITIDSNANLVEVGGYDNLSVLGEGLIIENNPALTTISGFSALVTIGGERPSCGDELCTFYLKGGLDLINLPELTAFSAFSALRMTEGGIYLERLGAADVSFPELGDAGGGLHYVAGLVKNLSFAKVKTADYIQIEDSIPVGDGVYAAGELETVSMPMLSEVSGWFNADGFGALISLDLGNSWTTERFALSTVFSLPNLTNLGTAGLTKVGSLDLYLGQPYSATSSTSLTTLEFTKLSSAENVSANLNMAGITTFAFPALKTVSSINLQLEADSADLETIDLSALEAVDYLYVTSGEGSPANLATVDFSALTTVETTLNYYLGIPSTSGQGLLMDSLTTLGTNAQTNYPTICSGYSTQQGDVNAACGLVSSLQTLYPNTFVDDCGQCSQQ